MLLCHYYRESEAFLQPSIGDGVKSGRKKKTKKFSRIIIFFSIQEKQMFVRASSVNNAKGFIAPSSGQELHYCTSHLDQAFSV